jgi:hypothetical protein
MFLYLSAHFFWMRIGCMHTGYAKMLTCIGTYADTNTHSIV